MHHGEWSHGDSSEQNDGHTPVKNYLPATFVGGKNCSRRREDD